MTDFTFDGNLQVSGLRFTAQPESTFSGIGNGLEIDTTGNLILSSSTEEKGWYLTQPEGDNEGRPGKTLYTQPSEVDSVIISKPGSINYLNGRYGINQPSPKPEYTLDLNGNTRIIGDLDVSGNLEVAGSCLITDELTTMGNTKIILQPENALIIEHANSNFKGETVDIELSNQPNGYRPGIGWYSTDYIDFMNGNYEGGATRGLQFFYSKTEQPDPSNLSDLPGQFVGMALNYSGLNVNKRLKINQPSPKPESQQPEYYLDVVGDTRLNGDLEVNGDIVINNGAILTPIDQSSSTPINRKIFVARRYKIEGSNWSFGGPDGARGSLDVELVLPYENESHSDWYPNITSWKFPGLDIYENGNGQYASLQFRIKFDNKWRLVVQAPSSQISTNDIVGDVIVTILWIAKSMVDAPAPNSTNINESKINGNNGDDLFQWDINI